MPSAGRHRLTPGDPSRFTLIVTAISLTVAIGGVAVGVAITRDDPSVPPPRATSPPTSPASPSPSVPPGTQLHPSWPIPGYLMIADRGNDRVILIDGRKRILWRYPRPGVTPAMPFNFDDDVFFGPGYHRIVSNQETQQTIQVVTFPGGRLVWHYGRVNRAGLGPSLLHTPDDAYLLPNGVVSVADVVNCQVIFLSPSHHVIRRYGTPGRCGHAPPRLLSQPNGDTPIPGGGTLITEITGSWVDAIGADGKLMWAVRAPVRYPSDAQWLGGGKILLADYSKPGHVLIMDQTGKVLWRYGPPSGPGMLDHPSLAMMLPNGLIVVNDDFRDRVIVIDPKKDRIVWQYGHTGVGGTRPGYLHTPDGLDLLPFDVAMQDPAIRKLVSG